MKIGSVVYATDQGLGNLAKSFYDARVVTDVVVFEHSCHVTHAAEWYPGATVIPHAGWRQQLPEAGRRMIDAVDAVLFFETPFVWELVEYARIKGKRCVIMPMYECMPRNIPHQPDVWCCPSTLDYDIFFRVDSETPCVYIPVPVQEVWRKRERARRFVHNAGHGGLRGRNGTKELVEAVKHVTAPVHWIFRSQHPKDKELTAALRDNLPKHTGASLSWELGTMPRESLYDGDVFVFPDKFNGLSLPLQEAFASGMLVMSTNRFPANTWLPVDPLIPVKEAYRVAISGAYMEYYEAVVDPKEIARTVDAWYDRDISIYSEMGRQYGIDNSWEKLKPGYMELLEGR